MSNPRAVVVSEKIGVTVDPLAVVQTLIEYGDKWVVEVQRARVAKALRFAPFVRDEVIAVAGSEAQWVENYYTSGHRPSVVFDQADVEPITDEEGAILDDDGSYRYTVEDSPVYNEKKMNRLLYITHAVVLGKDAAIGLGPRIGLQVGWTNLPYALQTTLHAGWTLQMPGFEKATNRVRPIVDIDLRGGTSFPLRYSLSKDEHRITVDPLFGLTAGVGTTF